MFFILKIFPAKASCHFLSILDWSGGKRGILSITLVCKTFRKLSQTKVQISSGCSKWVNELTDMLLWVLFPSSNKVKCGLLCLIRYDFWSISGGYGGWEMNFKSSSDSVCSFWSKSESMLTCVKYVSSLEGCSFSHCVAKATCPYAGEAWAKQVPCASQSCSPARFRLYWLSTFGCLRAPRWPSPCLPL